MNSTDPSARPDPDSADALLTSLLVEFDEALADDTPRVQNDDSTADLDTGLQSRLDKAQHCISLLDRVRRRWNPKEATETAVESVPPPRPPDQSGTEAIHGDKGKAPQPRDVDRANEVGAQLRLEPSLPASGTLDQQTHIGRFAVERTLGRGGLGIVFLAYDPNLGRNVALKVPRFESLVSEEMRRRFLREAEAAARLSHPNLVAVHEVGEDGPFFYIASEYCQGGTLAAWIERHGPSAADEPQPWPPADRARTRVAAQWVHQLALAVQHAHGLGVLHRDIKPSNVLIKEALGEATEAGAPAVAGTLTPMLTDFGMARILEADRQETKMGALLGTLAYMAPEQAEGRVEHVDVRSTSMVWERFSTNCSAGDHLFRAPPTPIRCGGCFRTSPPRPDSCAPTSLATWRRSR